MSQQQWQKVVEVFHAALERAADERQRFLEQACGGDADLRSQVELLLAKGNQGSFPAAGEPDPLTTTQTLFGRQFGPYRILAPLGAGGMGEVYRAHDSKLGRDVAIKTLPHEFARDPERMERFRREARTLAALNHPNIGAIYDMKEFAGVDFLVLELVEGDTLAQQIQKGGPLPIGKALECARQIAEALEAAHDKGIIHRDLKPANVKVTPQDRVKVLDFGLAKIIWKPEPRGDRSPWTNAAGGESVAGHIVGTPSYMSPEQARGEDADKRMDTWAFGCLLYELLTGKRAFPGKSLQAILAGVLERDPDWEALPAKTPARIRELLRRCLDKDAGRRLQNISDARALVEEAQRKEDRPRSSPTAETRSRKAVRRRIRSLAVLPLENLSGDAQHEYFADGMTDALITTLAQIGALRIISRTSVMQYKGARKPLPEIARELNVEAVLEGTVLRSGSRVRIAAQLIDAPSDTHLWAKNYESDVRDILTVQSEVAQAVAKEINMTLTPPERARFSATRPVDPEAYEAFLKGRYHWYRRSPEALDQSLKFLQQAVAKDPTYPLAHAGLADTYGSLGWDLFAGWPPTEAFPKAREAAQKALALDPLCAEAHASLGHVAGFYEWNWEAAEKSFRRALELKPQYGVAHIWYSHVLHAMGRFEESFAESQRAIECDPLGLILNVHLGWNYVYDRNYERGIEQLRKTIELEPAFILARLFLGEAYEQTGRLREAIAEFEKAADLSGRRPVYLAGLGHAYAVAGQHDRALNVIEELKALAARAYVPARGIAEIYIGLENRDQAFAWLDQALAQRNGWLFHVRSNPRYDSLRSDSRYAELVRRIGLP